MILVLSLHVSLLILLEFSMVISCGPRSALVGSVLRVVQLDLIHSLISIIRRLGLQILYKIWLIIL